jgi:hypothetical protein
MVAKLEDRTLDFGLNELDTLATHIRICGTEPSDYASATTANVLGFKNWGAGNAFGAPGAGTPNGRKVSSIAITDGTITTAGTANWWAVTDETNSRYLAHGTLNAAQAVSAGNSFSLGAFDITIPSQA